MASYSNEQIDQVKELASVFFTPKEIAVILEFDELEFVRDCQDESSMIGKAFLGGKLQSELKIRKSIIQLANSGSSPAQAMSLDIIKQSNLKMLDR